MRGGRGGGRDRGGGFYVWCGRFVGKLRDELWLCLLSDGLVTD